MNTPVDLKSYAPKTAAAIQNAMKADFADLPPHPPKLLSADAILSTDWPEPKWAVPGILPAGLAILAGRPKVGKSWLALQIAQAVASGGQALGEHVEAGKVLYLALEDPARRLAERMKAQRWPSGLPCDFITIGSFQDTFGSLNGGGAVTLAALIEDKHYRLVIIDTLSRAIQADQNDVSEVTTALTPLQEAAQNLNITILLIDHHKKANGADPDAVSDILGSTGKGAMADALLGLYKERGKRTAKLAITGRDIIEQTLALEWDTVSSCWQLSDAADCRTTKQDALLDTLEAIGPATISELAECLGRNRGTLFRQLCSFEAQGIISRDDDKRWLISQEREEDE